MKLADIRPYPDNAKEHTKVQIAQIAASIKAFGFQQPIVVDTDGVIIIGHGRYEAAKILGLEDVPATVAAGLTPDEVKALRLADNKLNESPWNMKLVIPELKGLSPTLLELTGFDTDLILDQKPEDDEVPDEPKEVRSKPGDLYEIGRHRVLCGDSTTTEALARLMGEQKADMVFTDPPYNVDYVGKNKNKLTIQNDNKSAEGFAAFLTDAFVTIAGVAKSGAPIYVCHSDSYRPAFQAAFEGAGFLLKQVIIWNKDHFVMGRQDYQWKHEPILYGWRDGGAHTFYGGRTETTVWDVKRPTISLEHPTMKPIELVSRAIQNSSKGEDIILDTFGGSGSTLIASEKTGRSCYTVELDPKYVDVIVQRWVNYTGTEKIKLNGKEITWPANEKAS